jgi:gamma-glutamyltranspeptidase
MLEAGGNAADAAVAAGFAIAVVEPTMNSIGGRTQILLRLPDGEVRGIDATTQAPESYDPETAPRASYGYPVIGVPGAVAGLVRLSREFGTLPLETVMEPAIEYAETGFRLLPGEARRQAAASEEAAEFPGTREYFLQPDGTPYEAGDVLVQKELAETLRSIARTGGESFYRGTIARQIAEDMEAHGGAVTLRSLEEYVAEDALVVTGSYRGYELAGSYIPAAGALSIEALHILENFPLGGMEPAQRAAVVGQALGLAFEDWGLQGSPEMARRLTSKEWAAERAAEIQVPAPAGTASSGSAPDQAGEPSFRAMGSHTTHLSTADADGMMVALTQTLGPNMGSKVATPGLGFLYASTLGGYLGRMEPGERARSNICPLLVLREGRPVMALGAAGGRMIPVAVVNAVVHFVDEGLPFPEAVMAPRVSSDRNGGLLLETHPGEGWSSDLVDEIRTLGLPVELIPREASFGRIHGIHFDAGTGLWTGMADPDWEGTALGARTDVVGGLRGNPGGLVSARPGRGAYDVIIRNGRVLDGTGNDWFRADVGLRGDRIAAVGNLSDDAAPTEIDATGLFVAPGFIDTHTHAGGGLTTEGLSHARPLLAQGITTILANPDGRSPLDLEEQRDRFLEHGLGVNVGQMVGHGSVRQAVLGMEDRLATPDEMEEMKTLLRDALAQGAFGFSAGPFYTPGSYSDTREHVELGKVAAEFGVPYQSHVRDEADYSVGVIAAVEEIITVAREAGIPTVFTHAKVLGPNVWGFSRAIVHRIERARREGLEVWADQYPYPASATGLTAALLPRWAQAGGGDSLRARLDDPETLRRIREAMVENLARRGGAHRIQFRRFTPDPTIEGRLLSDLARERGEDPIEVAIDLFRQGSPGIVSFNMHEDDIRTFMTRPWTMTSSDGDLVPWMEGVPHPRSYGAFTRKVAHYAVEEGAVGVPFAIRSMTSLPARVYRLPARGLLQEGMMADVVVFDLEKLRDRATFTEPHQLAEGMVHVFVNGVAAIRNGSFTDAMAGRTLVKR